MYLDGGVLTKHISFREQQLCRAGVYLEENERMVNYSPYWWWLDRGGGVKNAEFWIFDSKRSSHLNTKNQMEHENLLCNLHKELAKNETNVKENDEQKQPDGKE